MVMDSPLKIIFYIRNITLIAFGPDNPESKEQRVLLGFLNLEMLREAPIESIDLILKLFL